MLGLVYKVRCYQMWMLDTVMQPARRITVSVRDACGKKRSCETYVHDETMLIHRSRKYYDQHRSLPCRTRARSRARLISQMRAVDKSPACPFTLSTSMASHA